MTVELPKDAKGREIPLDTEVLYDKDGKEIVVSLYQYYPKSAGYWNIKSVRNKYYRQDEVYLTKPDSWEKLLDDLYAAGDARHQEACAYFNRGKDEYYCCESCPGGKDGCVLIAMRDITSRIRKLRGESDA